MRISKPIAVVYLLGAILLPFALFASYMPIWIAHRRDIRDWDLVVGTSALAAGLICL